MALNITEVRLLSVPLDREHKNTLYFASETEQYNYFNSRVLFSEDDFSYQRKDDIINYPLIKDEVDKCNYVMYRNEAYSNKWFYAFITDTKYKNEGMTDIYIETDPIQTWLFDFDVKASFIEREHVNDDTIGLHVQEEGLQIGDYVVNGEYKEHYSDDLIIVVGATKDSDGKNVRGGIYNGIYSGLKYFAFPQTAEGVAMLTSWLDEFDEDGAAEAIQVMFLAPKRLVPFIEQYEVITQVQPIETYVDPSGLNVKNIDGYNPTNNKLYTYPYRYLMVTNNNGSDVAYHFEDFPDGQPVFNIYGCLTPGCSVRMEPRTYKEAQGFMSEGINLGKFPALNWTSDYFTNWLTQNSVNIGVGVATSIVSTGLAIAGAVAAPATGGGSLVAGLAAAGAVAGGAATIGNTMGEVYKASLVPPQSKGNTNCGDVIAAIKYNDFHFFNMNIKAKYARLIDKYFTMFGYKVNELKVPNKAHRKYFWYTKTIDANIYAKSGKGIPQNDLQAIKNCYNNGITFWRNNGYFGDYTTGGNVNAIV